MVKKLSELYLETRKQLMKQEEPQSASLITRNLLCHVTGKTQEQLLADMECYVGDSQCQELQKLLDAALAGEPLAYVLNQWDFYGMTLYVDHNVLIPRDDTCAVTDLALKYALFLDPAPRILDLCTGSGCIGLAVASRVTDAKVTLGDISPEALGVAKKNISLQKLAGRVKACSVNALDVPPKFLGTFQMIISNPPYITKAEMEELPDSVKNYEPHLALDGGTDGLDFYRAICENFKHALKPGGYLCFEFGMGQGNDVCAILEMNGYTILERSSDYNDIERAVIARYDRKEA